MNSLVPFYFHVGMYRTATTTFQQALFQKHSGVNYFGKPFPHPALDELITSIACHDSARYDHSAMQTIVEKHVLPYRQQGGIPLFSQELMASYGATDTTVVARRLKKLFGDCRVFISIRKQDNLLLSYYLQTAFKKYNAYLPLKRWLERQYKFRAYHDSLMHLLHYDGLVHAYESVLGAENVLVLPFEQFVADKKEYLNVMCAFMGLDSDEALALVGGQRTNASKGEGYQRAMQFRKSFLPLLRSPGLDAWLVRICSMIWRGTKPGVHLSEKWRGIIGDMYAFGNKKLSERRNLNLKQYGYF